MLNAAKIIDNKVDNIIYVSERVFAEWSAQGQELIDREPLGLTIGDYRRDGEWYRMVDGHEVQLPIPEDTGPSYDELLEYYQTMKEALEA